MAKHSRRRQRRSPSSSVERTQDVEDSAAVDAPSPTSGQRAPEGPAVTSQADQSAVTSPIGQTNRSPRARKSPADVESPSQSALESPADDDPRPHEQILREVSCEDSGQSEGESLDSTNALSSKRKAVEAEDDPIASTLQQLREELKQLRQERQDRE